MQFMHGLFMFAKRYFDGKNFNPGSGYCNVVLAMISFENSRFFL